MKQFLVTLFFLQIGFFCLSQSNLAEGCADCEPTCLCNEVIDPSFTPTQKKLLRENWTDFAGPSLEDAFPINRTHPKKFLVATIKMDGMGCIYPPFLETSSIRNAFIDKTVSEKRFYKNTFYHLIHEANGLREFSAAGLGDQATELQSINDYFSFIKTWNHQFLPDKIAGLNNIIRDSGIKKIYAFVSGFNVPYGLAQLQGNAYFSDLIRESPANTDFSKVLFIRIFYPVLSKKRNDFFDGNCNIKDRSLKVLKTGLFSYVSNRTYLCAITMRDILNQLNDAVQINFISHSFGSSLTTAIVLDPKNKMGDTSSDINSQIVNLFADSHHPIPATKRINFFMSSPGMPGINTFNMMDAESNNLHKFFIGYNNNDKIQLKKILFLKLSIKKSSTSLGCNFHGEAHKVMDMALYRSLERHFDIQPIGMQETHDIFCYRKQLLFKSFFRKFVTESMH